jgi:hypothetical protein
MAAYAIVDDARVVEGHVIPAYSFVTVIT